MSPPSIQAIALAIGQREAPFLIWTPGFLTPSVDWVKMRDAAPEQDWRTYIALRHMLKAREIGAG